MKPADIIIALLVAIIWGLAFVASRIALDELSPELMTAMRFIIAAVPLLVIGGIAVMILAKRPPVLAKTA
jgi:O-acetylserine/cysteine efflux transporter